MADAPSDLQLWRTPGRWRLSSRRVVRIRELDAVGRVLADGRADRSARALHPLTELVAVQPRDMAPAGPVPGAAGWQLHTRAHPVAQSAFLTRTAGVATDRPAPLPRGRDAAGGVEMFRVVAGCLRVVTDLPAAVSAVLVQLDPVSAAADLGDVEVSAGPEDPVELTQHAELGTGAGRRRQLLYTVGGDHAARAVTSITVRVPAGPDGAPLWLVAGVVGVPVPADVLAAAVRDDPQADLVPDPPAAFPAAAARPASLRSARPAPPVRPRFTPAGGGDG